VHFLDVGAGDAAVIEFPGHQVLLIDGGGLMDENFDMGKAVLSPFLYSRGIRKVDIVALTHPHQDHAGGLPYIAEHFQVRELWHNGERSTLPAFGALMAAVNTNGIKTVICSHETPAVTIDTVRIDFLNPLHSVEDRDSEDQTKTNNNSLVIKLTYGSISFLFTADILEDTEETLVAGNAPIAGTIMKVPHHGGINSSSEAFVKKVTPSVAVISGRAFGYKKIPKPEIERRYKAEKTVLYQTDIHGTVQIKTDGITYRVATYTGTSQ
jgi:competence protein ComEC